MVDSRHGLAPDAAPDAAPEAATAATPAAASAVPLCASGELVEKGLAHGFDVLHFRVPARGFALRFEGRVVAYLNRCLHVPVEMDWNPGDFLDGDKTFILCATHGAAYEPLTGRCAGGPCGRGRLTAIETVERGGQVYWYPSRDTKPAPAGVDPAVTTRPS